MLFSSTTFLFGFLPCLLLFYFLIPQGKSRERLWWKNLILLLFSLVFYAWGGVAYLGILIASVAVNYLGGLFVTKPASEKRRKLILALTVAANLGLLGWFKYANFAASVLLSLGLPAHIPGVVLPAGISFFTFQGMSYVIDVYRRDAAVQKNPMNVALYISLFPQIMSGPIVRYASVESALTRRSHTVNSFADGVTRFMLGFGKKMILADAMGDIADQVFAPAIAGALTTPLAWVGAVAYTLQIYLDFSAYSDMAIGLGRMFGFDFRENFNYPYIASSVTDFWRRWHISLSSWFRDYVYIPLGGNRCSKARHIFNLLVVWSLTGLWHGANWTFIVWGLYFGVLLICEKYLFAGILPKLPAFIRHALTMLIVILSWVLFRSDTMGGALSYIGVMFGNSAASGFSGYAVYFLRQYYPELILSVIAVFPVKKLCENFLEKHRDNKFISVFGFFAPKIFACAVFVLGYFKLVSGSFSPFIYFQF